SSHLLLLPVLRHFSCNPLFFYQVNKKGVRFQAKRPILTPAIYLSYFFAYFFLNFSTLPSASISFCFPVKNGWHFEHISRRIFSSVDFVVNVSPQAHTTLASLYFGCIPSFMEVTS